MESSRSVKNWDPSTQDQGGIYCSLSWENGGRGSTQGIRAGDGETDVPTPISHFTRKQEEKAQSRREGRWNSMKILTYNIQLCRLGYVHAGQDAC